MALARMGNARRVENFTWPGFVDALATLLMVIIFVLMVFVLVQVNLAYRVSGQDATLGEMRQQLASLSELLSLERKASAALAADLAQITTQLDSSNSARDDLSAQLATLQSALDIRNGEVARLAQKQRETEAALAAAQTSLESRLGALQLAEAQLAQTRAQKDSVEKRLAASEEEKRKSGELLARATADAKATTEQVSALQAENSNARSLIQTLEAETKASKTEVLQLTNALAALRLRVEELTALLGEKEAQAARDKVAIASLGKSLNNALASRVQELQRFRSEFFGRLRDVLKGRDDVQIVGDRFVFQSEVLFAQGQAEIGPQGKEQLAKLAVTLNQIARKIPNDINWILQVDGHTDDVPVRAGRYDDNWDLSTERALSVVRFLRDAGLPANRLVAAGYGEFQPLDAGNSDDARRRNRRIELKITQRVSAK
jgi:chemotaxis protein MotB